MKKATIGMFAVMVLAAVAVSAAVRNDLFDAGNATDFQAGITNDAAGSVVLTDLLITYDSAITNTASVYIGKATGPTTNRTYAFFLLGTGTVTGSQYVSNIDLTDVLYGSDDIFRVTNSNASATNANYLLRSE